MSYSATDNGWMTKDVFRNYFLKVFLENIPGERPVVLVYDGHSSHIDLDLIKTAIANQIIIVKLPPHWSHVLQPLDISVFKPFKDIYDPLLVAWQRNNMGVQLPNDVFVQLVIKTWERVSPNVIANDFSKGGIHLFDNQAAPKSVYEKESLDRFHVWLTDREKAKTAQPPPEDPPIFSPEPMPIEMPAVFDLNPVPQLPVKPNFISQYF